MAVSGEAGEASGDGTVVSPNMEGRHDLHVGFSQKLAGHRKQTGKTEEADAV
jgi:hypothetical protein